MSETGFLAQQQRRSPTGFALVVAAHVAGLGALALMGTPVFERFRMEPIDTYPVPLPPDPPPPSDPQPRTQLPSGPTALPTPVPDPTGPMIGDPPEIVTFDPGPIGPVVIADAGPPAVPHTPIRRAAVMLSSNLQPPYPASMQREQRSGRVEIRVTIGIDGRVTAVEQLFASSDAFWRATERQALTRWRFRPATEDGRPVVGTKTVTVTFRIEDLEV